MRVDFAAGMGRNERMDEIAGLARLADECGFAHVTFVDEPYARLMTQRIIDCVHMIGTPDEIREKIGRLVQAGATSIATATYTILDKAGMLRAIADEIMPHFRN